MNAFLFFFQAKSKEKNHLTGISNTLCIQEKWVTLFTIASRKKQAEVCEEFLEIYGNFFTLKWNSGVRYYTEIIP